MPADNHNATIAPLVTAAVELLEGVQQRISGVSAEELPRFLASFKDLPVGCGYRYVPPEAHQVHARVKQEHGAETAMIFLFAAVVASLIKTLNSTSLEQLPARVRAHQLRHFQRIVTHHSQTELACELSNDLFLKDFGIASLRLYAGGSNLIDVSSGIGRSALWKGGLSDVPRRIAIFLRTGGFKPFFEIHAHKFYMTEFNDEGRKECYHCCAELYAVHPEVRGMIAGSWFYDPAVSEISPHLAYLREVPQQGGAYLLFDSFDAGAARNAVATSRTRKRLVEEGKYRPAAYMLLWPRTRHLEWANNDQFRQGQQ